MSLANIASFVKNTLFTKKQNKEKGSDILSENNNNSAGLSQRWSETIKELKKVHWPTKKQLFNYTVATIFVVLVSSVAFYIIDSALGFLITKLVSM